MEIARQLQGLASTRADYNEGIEGSAAHLLGDDKGGWWQRLPGGKELVIDDLQAQIGVRAAKAEGGTC